MIQKLMLRAPIDVVDIHERIKGRRRALSVEL